MKPPTNHRQTSHTTHKLSTNHLQTGQIPDKPPTNHPKIASFPRRHFLWLGINSGPKNRNICHPTKYDFFTHPVWEEKWVCFFIFLPDLAFLILHCTALFDPQLQTTILTINYCHNYKANFSRSLGLTMLHWKFCLC